jgi:leader peptidase (prepilin peptidase)/N-methyltransferase
MVIGHSPYVCVARYRHCVPTAVIMTGAAVLGLLVGSFLNVVIYRVPIGESIVSPGSHCPACGRPIRGRHNIPVLSWVVLRGHCADCNAAISARYPAVELGTGVAFALLTWWAAAHAELAVAPAWCYLAAVGIALAMIDLDTHRLPNVIVLPSYAVLAVLLTIASIADGHPAELGRALLGMLALAAFFLVVRFAYPKGMGWGDVKLAGLLGLALGYVSWAALVIGGFAGFALGAVVGVAVIAAGHGNRKSVLPFGPFMIIGAFLGLLVGGAVSDWYLRLIA